MIKDYKLNYYLLKRLRKFLKVNNYKYNFYFYLLMILLIENLFYNDCRNNNSCIIGE